VNNDGEGKTGAAVPHNNHNKKKNVARPSNKPAARRRASLNHSKPRSDGLKYELDHHEILPSQTQQKRQVTWQLEELQPLSSEHAQSPSSMEHRRLENGNTAAVASTSQSNTETSTLEEKPKKRDHPSVCHWDKLKV
jgi:hypothetical protein